MSAPTTYPRRTKCPTCDKWVSLSQGNGRYRHHGPRRNPCPTSGRTLDEVAPTVTAVQMAALRDCWRIGDVKPVEDWLGEQCPPYVPATAGWDHCLECELNGLVQHARQWITQTLRARGIAP